jgi:O-succinylbenzoate synthase
MPETNSFVASHEESLTIAGQLLKEQGQICSFRKLRLEFNFPARTSRNTMNYRDVWILSLGPWQGECAPLPGLSPDWSDEADYETRLSDCLQKWQELLRRPFPWEGMEAYWNALTDRFPSIAFGIESLLQQIKGQRPEALDWAQGRQGIRMNGLIWMNDVNTMLAEAHKKVNAGFTCLKFKVGALDWEAELDLLKEIRQHYSAQQLEIRVDANGAFGPDLAPKRLEALQKLGIHSIEQPLPVAMEGHYHDLCALNLLPVALDESLLVRRPGPEALGWLSHCGASMLVLKPGLLGGFAVCRAWIAVAESLNMQWWITSALESNLGLSSVADWTYSLIAKHPKPLAQGLGTGSLYRNNLPSSLEVRGEYLFRRSSPE